MSYSLITILVSLFLLTDPCVNENKSTTIAAKRAVKKNNAAKRTYKKEPVQKLQVFDSSPLIQTLFFN